MAEQKEISASISDQPTGSKLVAAAVCAATGLAPIRISGEDATEFLNAQATAAFREDFDGVQPAALADPKGRVLAGFQAWRQADSWLLALAAGEAEWLCAHLARFVFRSRVNIAPARDLRLFGVVGTKASPALGMVGLPAPAAGRLTRAGPLTVLGLPGWRWLVAGEEIALADATRALTAHATPGGFEDWKRARLLANEVEIRAETRGRFLPQMLGLVELGAVSFRKGCYPGQEIIARTQHLGRVKRGLALLRFDSSDSMPEAGSTATLEGVRFEVLDSVALPGGGAWVQAVAPLPL